ncbi:predicted protein [Plenodomus lingam JN3]|uniref:Predicted protein n=1 Tax=Leptosphaeria maculans (strain JN3 / isolate v23.1.3 / race Av1-4-5-6-7-8) TaxID=985895 RepID=E5ACD8_LEPMJ|nr:predicted protein [Plenodomus lingam JN3]CBY02140.1 predicted protein [Plenodomus lingam JN3]
MLMKSAILATIFAAAATAQYGHYSCDPAKGSCQETWLSSSTTKIGPSFTHYPSIYGNPHDRHPNPYIGWLSRHPKSSSRSSSSYFSYQTGYSSYETSSESYGSSSTSTESNLIGYGSKSISSESSSSSKKLSTSSGPSSSKATFTLTPSSSASAVFPRIYSNSSTPITFSSSSASNSTATSFSITNSPSSSSSTKTSPTLSLQSTKKVCSLVGGPCGGSSGTRCCTVNLTCGSLLVRNKCCVRENQFCVFSPKQPTGGCCEGDCLGDGDGPNFVCQMPR